MNLKNKLTKQAGQEKNDWEGEGEKRGKGVGIKKYKSVGTK